MTIDISAIQTAAALRSDGPSVVPTPLIQAPAPAPEASSGAQTARQQNNGQSGQPSTPSPGTLAAVVDEMRRAAAEVRADVTFRIEEELQRVVVSVVDRNDGKVLRQIPSEEALRIAEMIRDGNAKLIEAIA